MEKDWLMIDLGKTEAVAKVRIVGRGDQLDRIGNFKVFFKSI